MKNCRFFLVAAVALFAVRSSAAQIITYLDENYKETNTSQYAYKRVIKYLKPIVIPQYGVGYYGNITVTPGVASLHLCSLTDYYKNGQPAFVVNVISTKPGCPNGEWSADGPGRAFYPNGAVKETMSYKIGKLNGLRTTYNENGTIKTQVEYQNGVILEPNKFAVPANSPFLGTWKYIKYSPQYFPNVPPSIEQVLTAVFSQDDILEIRVPQRFLPDAVEKTSWKYTPTSGSTGVLEQYQGNEMLYRGEVRWFNRNQFEYVCTFHPDASQIGMRRVWIRQ